MAVWNLDQYAPANRRAMQLDLVACAIAVLLVLLISVNVFPPVRAVVALAFTFFVPGRAIVSNWPRVARWSGVGMSIVFSLGTLTLLATVTLWTGLWSPMALFFGITLASLIGLMVSINRRRQLESARHEDR